MVFLYPIELLVNNYYLRKAKVILNSKKHLIKIGITGSFGKTTTKEILGSILSEQYNVLITPESYNTPMGISKTINCHLKSIHEIFVCEMGAKKVGEIYDLCELTDVDMGIVTSVARQHLNTFKNIENVYMTKKELPDYLNRKFCVFNLMNHYTKKMYFDYKGDKCGVFFYKKSKHNLIKCLINKNIKFKKLICYLPFRKLYCFPIKNNYYAKNIYCSESGISFDVFMGGKLFFCVKCNLIGYHNVLNILLAISMAKNLNVTDDNIVLALSKLKSIKARVEKFTHSNGSIVINNGYNSNIDSAESVLNVLNNFDRSHRVIITPGLIETGDDKKFNYDFGKLISKYATEVIVVKEYNRNSICDGLKDSFFDMSKVICVKNFLEARFIIDKADTDYVFLIENDLPDNFN